MADDGCGGGDYEQFTRYKGGGHWNKKHGRGYGRHYGRGGHYGRDEFSEQEIDRPYPVYERDARETPVGRSAFQRRNYGAAQGGSFQPMVSADQRSIRVVGPVRSRIAVPVGATYGDLKHYLGGKISPMFAHPDTTISSMDANATHHVDEDSPIHAMKAFFVTPEANSNAPQLSFKFPHGTDAESFSASMHGAAPAMTEEMHRLNSMFEHGGDKMDVHAGYDHHMQFFFDGKNDSIATVTRQIGKALYEKTNFPRYKVDESGNEEPKFHLWVADRHTGALIEPLDFRYHENGGASIIDAIDQITGGVDGSRADTIVLKAVAPRPDTVSA